MSLKALEVTIATLLSWLGLLQDGFKQYQQQDYAKAADALTQVILSDHSQTPAVEFARIYRAECYIQLNVPRQSHEDLAWLIRRGSNDIIVDRARKLFSQVGGELADHLPRESAKETVVKAMELLQAQRHLEFAEYLSGDLLATVQTWDMIAQAEQQGSAYARLAAESRGMVVTDIQTNAQWVVELALSDSTRSLQLEMEAIDQLWRFTRLKVYAEAGGVDGAAWLDAFPEQMHGNARTLKQFSEALELYAADNADAYPDEIEKLAGYLQQDLTLMRWSDPETREPKPFRYFSGLLPEASPQVPFALMCSPQAHQDIFMVWSSFDGELALFDSGALKALLDGLDIQAPGLFPEAVNGAMREKVAKLIKGLQAPDFKRRRAAKQELRALGEVAFPLLLEYKNHNDPEVKLTIEEILDGK